MNKYFFTFGGDTSYHNRYVVFECESVAEAREKVFLAFGEAWEVCYSETAFAGQPEKYNLKELIL